MSLKQFKEEDLFFNIIKTYPHYDIKIYKKDIYVNNYKEGVPKVGDINDETRKP